MSAGETTQKGVEKIDAQELVNQHPINKFLDVYEKEVQNRRVEIEARAADSKNQKDISLHTIDAQLEDRNRIREYEARESSKHKMFAGFLFLASLVFIGALVLLGQTQLAEMLIPLAGGAALGAFGGYGYAAQKFGRANRHDS